MDWVHSAEKIQEALNSYWQDLVYAYAILAAD